MKQGARGVLQRQKRVRMGIYASRYALATQHASRKVLTLHSPLNPATAFVYDPPGGKITDQKSPHLTILAFTETTYCAYGIMTLHPSFGTPDFSGVGVWG